MGIQAVVYDSGIGGKECLRCLVTDSVDCCVLLAYNSEGSMYTH